MSLEKKINIREDESIIRIISKFPLVDWWKYLLGFIFLAAASFWMFQLISFGSWGYGVYTLLVFVGLYVIFRTWFFSHFNTFIVTSERVVDLHRKGWFDEVMSSINYKDVKDVVVRKKGLFANIFSYGSLVIHGRSKQFVLEVIKVHLPQELQTLVDDLRQQYKMDRKICDIHTIYNNFVKIIPDLDDDKLNHIQELISNEFEVQDEEEPEEE